MKNLTVLGLLNGCAMGVLGMLNGGCAMDGCTGVVVWVRDDGCTGAVRCGMGAQWNTHLPLASRTTIGNYLNMLYKN
eukprot:634011-Pyramimonas_sp.AAC.1